ncbi:MAG: hypothetical protein JWN48_5871 [Myxococcaceae bacterium]|nr:hypothetical protein [Myxococcaceae bacterium]
MTGEGDSMQFRLLCGHQSVTHLGMWRAALARWMIYLDTSLPDADAGTLANEVGRNAVHTPIFQPMSERRGRTASVVTKRLAQCDVFSRCTDLFSVEGA